MPRAPPKHTGPLNLDGVNVSESGGTIIKTTGEGGTIEVNPRNYLLPKHYLTLILEARLTDKAGWGTINKTTRGGYYGGKPMELRGEGITEVNPWNYPLPKLHLGAPSLPPLLGMEPNHRGVQVMEAEYHKPILPGSRKKCTY